MNFLTCVLVFILTSTQLRLSSSHEWNPDDNSQYQGLNIQITGIPTTSNRDQNTDQHCKVGKAGPKGDVGQKGERGDPAESCECPDQQELIAKIDHLETILLRVTSKGSRDCSDVNAFFPFSVSSVQTIRPSSKPVQVMCDVEENGDVWTVIQRRFDGTEDFYRDRADYINGFGEANSEYWLGLDIMHSLTRSEDYELKVDVESWDGDRRHALYSDFRVGDRSSDYVLTVRGYSGNAGDSMSYHSGMRFSTKDHDVDPHSSHCAQKYMGGWWYNACYYANPNGLYFQSEVGPNAQGVEWWHFYRKHNYSMKKIQLKIRKKL